MIVPISGDEHMENGKILSFLRFVSLSASVVLDQCSETSVR